MHQCLLPLVTTCAFAGIATAQSLLGADYDTGDLYTISTLNGAPTFLVATGLDHWSDVEFAPNGTLWGVRIVSGAFQLHQIDPQSGQPTFVTTIALGGSAFEGDITFTPAGEMYGANYGSSGAPGLYSFDTNTLTPTPLGAVAGSHDFNGIGWRSDGHLLGLDRVTNAVLVIDPTSLQVVTSFPLSTVVGAVGALTSSGGAVYFATGGPGTTLPGSNELWILDPFTGAHTLVGPFTGITGIGIAGLTGAACSGGVAYCTSGTSAQACLPALASSGLPALSATSGFALVASNLDGQRQGLIFYGLSGEQALQWAVTSSSFLCVKPPTQRTPVHGSGGTLLQCDGTLAVDWLAFVGANPAAVGVPFASGTTVWAQAWYRDPASPKTTSLTNGVRFTTCP